MRISDWSSDVCSSDLGEARASSSIRGNGMTIITVADAKADMNISGDADDALIADKLATSEAWIRQFIGRPLDDATAFPDGTPRPENRRVGKECDRKVRSGGLTAD